MTPRWARRSRLLAIGAAALGTAALTGVSAAATTPTCATVSIATMNSALGIDAAHVTSLHPPKNPSALICSYYGNSGRAANEATINYLRLTGPRGQVKEKAVGGGW